MERAFFREYLDLFAGGLAHKCACGRSHSLVTREVLMGPGVLAELAPRVAEEHGARARVWMLSDENTRAAAGKSCRDGLGKLSVSETVLPRSPRPRTTMELAERLAREAGACRPQLVLGVGAGTISDLGKMVSLSLEVPNWCVATAPSVDAYGSATSATKAKYRARAVPCRASERIICDLDVLVKAPPNLFLAGLGDLLAKFLAFLDWNVAALVTGEYYCSEAATLALESARRAIEAAAQQRHDPQTAVRSLTDALLTSSFAMQAVGNSRPAATAEHTVGHFWEIAHLAGNPERELHGLLAGLASRLVFAGYRRFYANLPDLADGKHDVAAAIAARISAIEREPSWKHSLEPAMQPFRRWLEEETAPELYTPRTLNAHLIRYQEHRGRIEQLARRILSELGEAIGVLENAGYPFRLKDYALGFDQALLPFRYVRWLRRRYSSFNLAYTLGREGEVLDRIREEVENLA